MKLASNVLKFRNGNTKFALFPKFSIQSLQLRFQHTQNRNTVIRNKSPISIWKFAWNSNNSSLSKPPNNYEPYNWFSSTNSEDQDAQKLGKAATKKMAIFTCKICDTRSARTFSMESYTKGVVIVTCFGCKNRHVIADNLGWFGDDKNIEETLQKRGEEVFKSIGPNDTIELLLQKLSG